MRAEDGTYIRKQPDVTMPNGNTIRSIKTSAIDRAIAEVNLNTPDSIGLAITTLKSKDVEIPQSLQDLLKLHEKFQRGRNGDFVQQSHDLQIQVLSDLNKLRDST